MMEKTKRDVVFLVKIYDSTGRLLPIVTAFATRKGAEDHVHKFLPTDRFNEEPIRTTECIQDMGAQ